ncbi:MAG: hypothetical protein K8I30_03585, partial [Anaerolineae bacterium]|nr:hypothetical protein [Anaerolineae bacterium]
TQRVNGIPVFKYGSNNFYAGDEKIFAVGTHRSCADHLAGLLILRMAQTNGVPRDYAAFQEGKTIQYDGVQINKNGLGGNKQSVRWDEIDKMDFKNDHLRVKRLTDKKLRKFGYVSPVASYYLMGLLDRVRGTDFIERKTAQLSRSRGQIWAAQGRQFALVLLIIAPFIAGLIAVIAHSETNGIQTYSGLRQINAQYGTNIGIACAGGQYDTYAYGVSQTKKHKFLIIDSTNNNNPRIHDEFQTALALKEQATSGADLTTVVCIWEDPYLVGQCPYGDVTRKRYREDYVVSLIEVETNTIIDEDYIPGTKPDSCPKTDPGSDLYGSLPTSAAFTTWLHQAGKPAENSL